ncbi:MAG: tetratricopeptide repeat protein [Lutibacter sp.]|uniref:tetratricopeptide repeat protein n=1 Tax=Lutibacter sp. TaxID=1925666 RepID=UPI00385BEB02
MKLKYFILTLLTIIIYSCSNNTHSPEFIKKASGKYLYNSDEIIKAYFKENELYLEWRGAKSIKPLKIDKTTFFVKEMNEKIQFLTNPSNNQEYIVLVPKKESKETVFNYKKLTNNEYIPSEYLKNNEFKKALEGYLAIQQKDSLDQAINEVNFNRFGYQELRKKNYEKAIQYFEINVALYPNSSNVYDSYADAFMRSGDTAKAILNYKKSLALDSGNKRAKKNIEKLAKSTSKN